MRRLHEFLFVRHRHNWLLLLRFGLVGLSGVLVNMVTLIIVKKIAGAGGTEAEHAIIGLPFSEFNIRWYHVFSTAAFFVANLWNFQLNRTWTFKSARHSGWWREYWPFVTVGLLGQLIGLLLLTLLMHRGSPIALPSDLLDDSTGLRTRLYWAQLLVIAVVTPVSFVLNKVWTFAAVRYRHPDLADPSHTEAIMHDLGDESGTLAPAGLASQAGSASGARSTSAATGDGVSPSDD